MNDPKSIADHLKTVADRVQEQGTPWATHVAAPMIRGGVARIVELEEALRAVYRWDVPETLIRQIEEVLNTADARSGVEK